MSEFNGAYVTKRLQMAQASAVAMAEEYYDNKINGVDCPEVLKDVLEMFNHIDSLVGFIPEGEGLNGTQPYNYFLLLTAIDIAIIGDTFTVTIEEMPYVYIIDTNDLEEFRRRWVAYFNSFPSTGYVASIRDVPGQGLTIYFEGTLYSEQSGFTLLAETILSGYSSSTGGSQGVDPTLFQAETCITNEQAMSILDRLNVLSTKPCTEVLNFG